MWAVALAVACWRPDVTGEGGMVGHLRDASGAPMAGVDVSTLEEHVTSGPDGRFSIQYKPPESFVAWRVGDLWMRRVYRPEDDGKVLELRLPALADATLACEVPAAMCPTPELQWDLGDGLFAKADPTCGALVALKGVPSGLPTVTCPTPVELVARDGRWVLRAPPTPLRVEVRGEEGATPTTCTITVDGAPASPKEAGFYVAQASGRAVVAGSCDGRPVFPKRVDAAIGSVAIEWSPTGPSLDLSDLPLPAGPIRVVREDDDVVLVLEAAADGRFALPPLPQGRYRVGIGDPGPLATLVAPEGIAPGALRLLAQSPTGAAGLLVVAADLESGEIPVVIATR